MSEGIDAFMLQQIAEVEQKDESQVLAELAGEVIGEMVYTVEVYDRKSKKKVPKAKLSWAGTKEVARSRGNIVLSEPVVTDLDSAIRFMVKATDLTRNFTVFGGCRQPRKMKVNDVDPETGEATGSHLVDDDYCFQKGLSKCQRNALTLCIPADYATKCITRFLRASGMRHLPQAGVGAKADAGRRQIKPRAEWDKVTPDMVPDFAHLEPIIWNLTKLQPAALYKELGVSTRSDMTIPAWDAFQALKERFAPAEPAKEDNVNDQKV